nr:uncharacterized protein LOC123764705 isoform X1 [Procambarus clarkii]XP_045608685.1 uncharacterized protein LOC123764705 isoform X1 [Procambarus clarkii]XP_045608686.1 uncharacterized protein LOC123764705 isoform X1 [Procambarus clarkii]
MTHQVLCTLLWSLVLCVVVRSSLGVAPGVDPYTSPPTSDKDVLAEGGAASSLEDHQLRKRFIWTLTQEPYFYGKYGRVSGEEGQEHLGDGAGSEMLPEAMGLRNPTSMHKRLYPRWYQAYVYKNPSFNQVAGPVGERKRFQPFHPLARFRGLALGATQYSNGYHAIPDMPLADHTGHRLPTAPNAHPSKYESQEDVPDEEEVGQQVRAGDLLQFLKTIASDRGLSTHTKGFRFGISRRK